MGVGGPFKYTLIFQMDSQGYESEFRLFHKKYTFFCNRLQALIIGLYLYKIC